MWSVIPLLPILNFKSISKGELKYSLKKISKQEMDYLIERNILKQSHGNYGDNLIVTGKFGNSRGKQRFVTTPTYNYLLGLQENDKQDINKIKDNQRYLFSNNDNNVSVS